MLFKPLTNKSSKRGLYGIVTSSGASGPWMRRLSFPVQTNTPAAGNWRHIFLTTKQNWLAAGPGGVDYVFTNGIAPQQAWAVVAAYYFGILEGGFIQSGVMNMSRLIGCASEDAYYTMCQANRASLRLAPLPTPALCVSQVQPPAANVFTTYGSQSVGTAPIQPLQMTPNPSKCEVFFSDTGNNGWVTSAVLSGAPAGVTALWDSTGTATAYANTPDNSSVELSFTVTVPNGMAAGALPITLSFTAGGSPQVQTLTFQIINNGSQPYAVPPVFAFPSSMGISIDYDTSYNVIGFFLSYTWVEAWTYPASPWQWGPTGWAYASGLVSPGLWEISASDQYTNSYAPPDPSTWQPILFSGPNMPTAAAVLAAWTDLYGALQPSGNIKFSACYIDPATGASGPTLSATAGWKAGTLEGAALSIYSGHYFTHANLNAGGFVVNYADGFAEISIQGQNGYGGTVAFSAEQSGYLATGTPPGTKTLPAGSSVIITPATLTIAPGDTSIYTATAEWNIPGASPFDNYILKIKATDGIQTASAATTFNLTGGSGPEVDGNFLAMGPATYSLPAANPGNTLVLITLSNTGPNDIDVDMSATADNPGVTLEFGTATAAAATATANSITFAYTNGQGVNGMLGQSISTAGYSPAGYNVTDVGILSSTDTTVTIPAPSNPGVMTTEGQIFFAGVNLTVTAGSIGTPGTATISMLVTLPGNFPSVGIQIQLVAFAGAYTANSGLYLT